jgi:hypothetical protein
MSLRTASWKVLRAVSASALSWLIWFVRSNWAWAAWAMYWASGVKTAGVLGVAVGVDP